ncbi:hypothetical protein [Nostoc sp.]|uniref:hypothetical protein n=1 Tax=Nostoc sp. TaxID=1180 RepID=UPI002FF65168
MRWRKRPNCDGASARIAMAQAPELRSRRQVGTVLSRHLGWSTFAGFAVKLR